MSKFRRQSLVAYGQPLSETTADRPAPRGTEVLVRVTCCGVCHSDLHVQDGYFALGGDRRLDITKDRALPFTLGHEIAGTIEAAGERAEGSVIGRQVAVYPWIGCGACAACRAGEENMCSAHHHLGISADGGFATYVLVPHPRYLLDYAPLAPSFAGPLMCSGLTAYSALKRLTSHAERGPVLLVGLGGVGMMGLALARTLFRQPPLVADIDAEKRNAALEAGAVQAFDPADPQTRKAILAAAGGGLFAVCDFVGSDKSLFHSSRHDRDQGHHHRGHVDRHLGASARTHRAGTRRKNRADTDACAAARPSASRTRRFARRSRCRPHGARGLTSQVV
jgi:alcohol dehydrogenase